MKQYFTAIIQRLRRSGWPGDNASRRAAGLLALLASAATAQAQLLGAATDYPAPATPQAAVVADVTADDRPDLVAVGAAGAGGGTLSVWPGQAGGTFGAATSVATTALYKVAVGDVNNDSRPDIVAIGTSLTVLLAQAGGGFSAPIVTPLTGEARVLRLRDLDQDGQLDVVTSLLGSDAVVALPGLGTGAFAAPVIYAAGGDVLDLDFADVTEDRIVDLVVVSRRLGNLDLPRLSVFPGRAAGGFGIRVNYQLNSNAASRPSALTIGDFDGDNRPDVAVADGGMRVLSVWLSVNGGVFGYRADYPLSGASTIGDVGTGDLNGDGRLDLVATNTTNATVAVLTGTGSGAFGAASNFAVANTPVTVGLADINADGRLDVVTANQGGNSLSVLPNTSLTASTAPTITAFTPPSGGTGTAVAITGTNFRNVTAVRFGGVLSRNVTGTTTRLVAVVPDGALTGPITVLTPSGMASSSPFTVTPTQPGVYLMNSVPLTLCSGTLYDTGGPTGNYRIDEYSVKVLTPATPGSKLQLTFTSFSLENGFDRLYIYDGDNTTAPLIGNYTGTTSPGTVVATNSAGQLTLVFSSNATVVASGFAATIACVGTPAFALTSHTPASNTANAASTANLGLTFSAAPTVASLATVGIFGSHSGGRRVPGPATVAGTTATLPVTGNAFAAGEPVLVTVPGTVQSSTGQVCLPYAFQFTAPTLPSTGRFGGKTDYTAGAGTYAVALGDVTGDGRPDLVTANQNAASISVLPGLAAGGFGAKVDYAAGLTPSIVVLGDVNRDGRLDVVTTNNTANTVSVLLATATGGLAARVSYPTGPAPLGAALGDFNGDGYLDLVVTNSGLISPTNNTVSVYLNSGTGTFGAATQFVASTRPVSVAVGDFNHDGRLDLVTANESVATVTVLLGLGDGRFGNRGDYAAGTSPHAVAVGDLNGDNLLDIAVAGQTAGYVNVLIGSAQGTFTTHMTYNNSAFASDNVQIADVNGDGRPDLLTSNIPENTITVLLTLPGGGYGTPATYATAPGARGLALADLNGDGRLDMADVNVTNGKVSVYLGLAPPSITGFSPASGAVGTSVTLTGVNFNGITSLQLNGTPITGYVVGPGGTSLTFTVPAGATSGTVVLTTAAGTATSGAFCVQYTPSAAAVSRCGPGAITLTATGGPASGGTYAWYDVPSGGTPLVGSTGPSYTIANLTSTTTYYVAIGTGAGPAACEGPRTAVQATVSPEPAVSIAAAGPLSFCQGGSVVLTASGASSYRWSTGQTTASITVSSSATVTVTGTNTAGCAATSAPATVVVTPAPAQPTITQNPTGTLTSSSPTGNQWYLDGAPVPGATGPVYVVPSAAQQGTYTVVVTSAAGCASAPSAGMVVVITAAAAPGPLSQLKLFPNPAHGTVTVQLPAVVGAGRARLTLVDALGRIVRRYELAPLAGGVQRELSLAELPGGVYSLRVEAGAATAVRRLVVE